MADEGITGLALALASFFTLRLLVSRLGFEFTFELMLEFALEFTLALAVELAEGGG